MSEVELGLPALAAVLVAGFVSALLTIWVFRRWAPRGAIGREVNRIVAHLMEFQLFMDEPVIVLRAQKDLITANLRLMGAMVRPSLILAGPFLLLFAGLDRWCGHAPPVPGEPVVATLHLPSAAAESKPWRLEAPQDLQVETPAVHIIATNEVSWRVRPLASFSGKLHAVAPGESSRAIALPRPTATVLGFHWLFWYTAAFLAGALIRI